MNSNDYKALRQFITDKRKYNVLIFSDTHVSVNSNFNLIRHAFDLEHDLALHAGDLFNGFANFGPSSTHDEYVEALNQFTHLTNNYPRDVGDTYFITGNHDLELSRVLKYNIGKAVSRARKNLIYMNAKTQDIRINNCNIRLRHQIKIASVFQKSTIKTPKALDDKNNIDVLAFGHRHEMSYAFVNNTAYLGLAALNHDIVDPDNGVWLLSLHFDSAHNMEYISSTYYQADNGKSKKLLKVKSF